MNQIVRLLDKILLNRIAPIIENANVPTFEHNLAYKKKKSPQDVLSAVLDALDIIRNHKLENAAIISVDFAKAFDSLSHGYILDFLQILGFPDTLIKFFQTRFMKTRGTLKDYLVDQTNYFFQISKGIPQGSALSGFIFILCLTPLLHMIEATNIIKPIEIDLQYMSYADQKLTFPKFSAFADDVNILVTIHKQGDSVPEIEALKEIFNKFQELSSLSVNFDKTFSFSSIDNKLLDYIETKYQIKN